MHFASELFDSHPRFAQLKSILLDFFNGEQSDAIALAGLEHVISVSLGPTPSNVTTTTTMDDPLSDSKESLATLPPIHIRTFTVQLKKSGTRVPRVQLTPMGPHLDLVLGRHTDPDPEMLKAALKRPKLEKDDVEKGLGKKRKNIETDDMGDLRGQIHIGKQDLSQLQVRKMKGLKEDGGLANGSPKKRRQAANTARDEEEPSDGD
jgi:ribosome production factor 2